MATARLSALLLEEAQWRAEQSLGAYIRQAWPVVEPATRFVPGWHIDLIAEHLEAVSAGQIKRLVINIPPRFSKSLLVSVFWPTWEWVNRPSTRWLFASYSGSLSVMHSMARRTLIESDWYAERWGGRVQLAADQNQKSEFENTARGRMVATSVGGTATGKGGTRIVIDDPTNPLEAESDQQRQAAIQFYRATLSTRLDDRERGAMVLIMQRLHERDLTGHLLDAERGEWTHLCLPMRAERREVVFFPSGRRHEREENELLCPARCDDAEEKRLKATMGSYAYAGQMQQRPAPAGGGIFARKHVQHWTALPARFDEIVQSWDCAFKALDTSDRVAGSVWGKSGADFYLLDAVSDQMGVLATAQAITRFAEKYPQGAAKLIEDAANGPAVCEILRDRIPGLLLVPTGGGKVARAYAVQPFWEAGNVWLPRPDAAPWVTDWIEEIVSFPRAAHDDRVDSMTHALVHLSLSGGGLAAFYDRQLVEMEQAAKKPPAPNLKVEEYFFGGANGDQSSGEATDAGSAGAGGQRGIAEGDPRQG